MAEIYKINQCQNQNERGIEDKKIAGWVNKREKWMELKLDYRK